MSLRSVLWPASRWRKTFAVLIGLVGLYALVGFVVLPLLLPAQIAAAAKAALGRDAQIGAMRINPFLLSVAVEDFRLADVDGSPMVEAGELFVDLDLASAWKRAVVLDDVRLAGLRLHAHVDAAGDLNLAALGASPEEPVAAEPAPTEEDASFAWPPITVKKLDLIDVRVGFRDDSVAEPFEFELGPLELSLVDLSTRPDSKSPYTLSATAPTGEKLEWNGFVTINPLQSSGEIHLANLSLARLWRYVRGSLPLDLAVSSVDVATKYELQREGDAIVVKLADGNLRVRTISVSASGVKSHLVALDSVAVDGVAIDVAGETVRVGRVALKGGNLNVSLDADGKTNFDRIFPGAEPSAEEPADATAPDSTWKVSIDAIDLSDFAVAFADHSVEPPLELSLDPIDVELTGVTTTPGEAFTVDAVVAVGEGGNLALALETQLEPLSVQGTIKASGLPLPAFQGYVSPFARLTIPSGAAGADGTVAIGIGENGATTVRYDGSLEILDLALREPEQPLDLLRWQRLGLNGVALDTGAATLAIETVEVVDPYAVVGLDDEGNLTIDRVVVTTAAAAGEGAAPPPSEAQDAGMRIHIGAVRLSGGTVEFTDRSVRPNFTTSLDELQVQLDGLRFDDLGGIVVDLSAKVDDDAPLSISGTISPPGHAEPTDVKVRLSGYDLKAVTPYVGRYVGYGVDKGKLTLELAYRLDKMTLVGANDVVAQRFSLGERVESADATTMPVKLALAVLRDGKGKIALNVPVRGDVNDPQFTLRGAILSTFTNILQRAVTSPFSILGSVVGIGADELSKIEFAAGSADLVGDEEKKIDGLAKALSARPGLQLEIRGVADTPTDAPALARAGLDAQLQQVWLAEEGLAAAALGGRRLEMDSATRQRLLLARYEEEFGQPLAATSGESDADLAGRAEAALLERSEVSPSAVVELGRQRSLVIRDALLARGVPREQLFRVKAKTVEKGRTPVPVELTLSTSG